MKLDKIYKKFCLKNRSYGPSEILGSGGKQNSAYVGARGVRFVALSFSSYEQTQ